MKDFDLFLVTYGIKSAKAKTGVQLAGKKNLAAITHAKTNISGLST